MRFYLLMIFTVFSLFVTKFCPNLYANPKNQLSQEDNTYLHQLMKESWDYIDSFIAPETGFPYDSNTKGNMTNTTNVGLYLAGLSVAHHLGYIKKENAIQKIRKIISSLEKIQNWDGLYNNWLDVRGDTKARPGPNNISDYNKLPAGLIMVRQEFPELRKECTDFLNKIPWQLFHERSTDKILFEYDVIQKKIFNPTYISRGEDKLLGAFLLVASGKVPASTWDRHPMTKEKKYGIEYLKPGWQGGGLFMQYICGMFLDETATKLGYSAANFAFAQMVHSEKIGSPVWGWSASEVPEGGYYGMGQLADHVVTPHASVLAIHYFPNEVIRNLKNLEKLGARQKFKSGSEEYAYGFRDSVNLNTGKVCPNYLVLDQAMVFLSLANFLENGIVRKIFSADPMVKHGLNVLSEYHVTAEDRTKFKSYVEDLEIPFCALLVEKDEKKEIYDPGDTLSFAVSCRNYTKSDKTACKVTWQLTNKKSGETLMEGSKVINLKVGQTVMADQVKYKISSKKDSLPAIGLSVKLFDSWGEEINSVSRLFKMDPKFVVTESEELLDSSLRSEYKVKMSDKSPLSEPKQWNGADEILLNEDYVEVGTIENKGDFLAKGYILWDSEFLYLKCDVKDKILQVNQTGADIYKEDVIEIFINPDNKGLVWGNPKDAQIGVTPPDKNGTHHTYAWFQGRKPEEEEVKTLSKKTEYGYIVSAAISWKFLGISIPKDGLSLGLSFAVNDVDAVEGRNVKLNWNFKSENDKIHLGKLILVK